MQTKGIKQDFKHNLIIVSRRARLSGPGWLTCNNGEENVKHGAEDTADFIVLDPPQSMMLQTAFIVQGGSHAQVGLMCKSQHRHAGGDWRKGLVSPLSDLYAGTLRGSRPLHDGAFLPPHPLCATADCCIRRVNSGPAGGAGRPDLRATLYNEHWASA